MTRRDSDTGRLAVATALDGVIVRGERNLLADTAVPGIEGARAALETFYYAFNNRSLDLLRQIWADDTLAQLETPLAGLLRGSTSIFAAYGRMLSSPVQIRTVLDDILAYITPGMAVFTEWEHGTVAHGGKSGAATELSGRSICIFRFAPEQGGWRLMYHQVSTSSPGRPAEEVHSDIQKPK